MGKFANAQTRDITCSCVDLHKEFHVTAETQRTRSFFTVWCPNLRDAERADFEKALWIH